MPHSTASPDTGDHPLLPPRFSRWFASRGWAPRAHQLALVEAAAEGASTLLIAPTGAGKTLAGFLPSLIELSAQNGAGLHTLYLSPLKALAVDIARNLEAPVKDMGLGIRIETRTGDTPASRRQRQRRDPPDILLTTPEQIALLLASADAQHLFGGLKRIIIDELHALAPGKRGDLLSLALARLRVLQPGLTTIGLSATVRDPDYLARWLTPQPDRMARIVTADRRTAAPPELAILHPGERIPWAGHTARHAIADVYAALKRHRLSLVFVNTRMQAEFVFQMLWAANDDNLRIALHHGSLDVGQRRRVEDAMAAGQIDAVVCTSTLDLGIDWGDVDLVVNVGAPKGASRLLQRIGRANHRLDEASRALLVPSNRFEVLECRAAIEAAEAGAQDAEVARDGGLDVLAQHILGMAVAAPFSADALFAEVTSALPYVALARADFDAVVDFAATGGYALKSYERFARIRKTRDGLYRVANPKVAQTYRLNIGTIVEEPMIRVRLGKARSQGAGATGPVRAGGRLLGEVEEYFIEQLSPGDTFVFGGEIVRFEALVENEALVSRTVARDPKVPSYVGGKFPLSTHLAARVRAMLADPDHWTRLPDPVREWLEIQRQVSRLPGPDDLLIETFPRGGRHYLVTYPFEGRLAHQTLGMLLTRRLERARLQPLGFVANDYALCVWGARDLQAAAKLDSTLFGDLFSPEMLGDDLEEWLAESSLMKRTFRNAAIIAGMIERRFPGAEKKARALTLSSDLIYDVLMRHQPDHILIKAARADAATGLLDIRRLNEMLLRIHGRIIHKPLDRVSPLAVPVMLEIGREQVYGEAVDALLEETAGDLVEEAMGGAAGKRRGGDDAGDG
ncbi:MAG: ligase-associated DNA damage response DEXH box helicase [Proteobacteria bacterium]|nr:ligase-associated DNA damage response DEXH box helicase [Pseudomonadota bacterium]